MRVKGFRDILGFLLLAAATRIMHRETWMKYREMIRQ